MKKLISALLSLLLALSLCLSLLACEGPGGIVKDGVMPKKDELSASVAEGAGEFNAVGGYLELWGFEPFHAGKFASLENLYGQRFCGELPAPADMAKTTAEYFIEYYYDEIDLTSSTEVTDALIDCYVAATGDPYSVYRTADEYVDYGTDMSGSFVGIGITVQFINNQILIITVYDDSPAKRAGIREGDVIRFVNGEDVDELGYERAIDNVRGEAGTNVTVTVLREGALIDCVATRAPITEISVSYELSDDLIGYIDISSFKSNTDDQFFEAIDYMKENGARAIIFDLRSNGGGYLDTVANMVDYLVPSGTMITSFGGYAAPMVAKSEHTVDLPVAILINEYTASASELFTAALRDYTEMGLLDCTVVGTKTFGKGVMQSSYAFSDKSAITLTVSYFYSPLGKSHNAIGIQPDIEVLLGESGDSQYERAYSELLAVIESN